MQNFSCLTIICQRISGGNLCFLRGRFGVHQISAPSTIIYHIACSTSQNSSNAFCFVLTISNISIIYTIASFCSNLIANLIKEVNLINSASSIIFTNHSSFVGTASPQFTSSHLTTVQSDNGLGKGASGIVKHCAACHFLPC